MKGNEKYDNNIIRQLKNDCDGGGVTGGGMTGGDDE